MREGVREGEKEGEKREGYKSVSIYIYICMEREFACKKEQYKK